MDEKKRAVANLVPWRHSFSMCAPPPPGWGEFFIPPRRYKLLFASYFHVRINKRKKTWHALQLDALASQINNKVSVRVRFCPPSLSALTSISNFYWNYVSVCSIVRGDNFSRLISVSPSEVWKLSSPLFFAAIPTWDCKWSQSLFAHCRQKNHFYTL